ncbi:Calcium-independent, partial [Pristimantis euphronides]
RKRKRDATGEEDDRRQDNKPCIDDSPQVARPTKPRRKRKRDDSGEEDDRRQDNKPCIDDTPQVARPTKPRRKRKRDDTGEKDDRQTKEKTERTPKRWKPVSYLKENFTFHRLLGSGVFGQVLLASHKPTNTMVAVKIVTKAQIIDKNPKTFTAERDVLEQVNESPLFVHLYQCFQTEEHLYYVLEHMGGGDLQKLLNSRGRLDTETIRFYAAELVCAISFLHSKRIIHRDLKPENILISTDGHLKVADFGISVILKNRRHYRAKSICTGTAGFMAPEVLSGHNYSFAFDWFSYGVILFYLATGDRPFKEETNETVIGKTIRCKVKYPNDMDRELKALLKNLLVKNPRKRLGADNIRSHPFFQNINWEDMELCRQEAPILRNSEEEECTAQEPFNENYLLPKESHKSWLTHRENKLFEGFSFTS